MFEKIRKVFVVAAVLCLITVPVAQASPVQYVDELGQSWVRILDFFEDVLGSVWSNSETSSDEAPPPSNNSTSGDGSQDDGSGDDSGGDGTPEFGPIADPIG